MPQLYIRFVEIIFQSSRVWLLTLLFLRDPADFLTCSSWFSEANRCFLPMSKPWFLGFDLSCHWSLTWKLTTFQVAQLHQAEKSWKHFVAASRSKHSEPNTNSTISLRVRERMDDNDDRICMNMLFALVFMSEAIHKVLRHVLTYRNHWSMNLACSPYLCSRASCPTGTLYQEYSPGSSVHPSRFWNQRFLAMSEIEPPWIANENLELYHLRFHLRSRARQLGSASTNSKSDSMSTAKKTCWVLFPRWKCVDPKPECTSWSSTCRFSQLNFDCKAESRCEIRSERHAV